VAIETDSGADALRWIITSLLSRADGSPAASDDFPVLGSELLRFVAFHEWRDRARMVDLAEDLEFLLRYYARGLHGWPQRVRTASWVLALRASRRRRRRRVRHRLAGVTRLRARSGFAVDCMSPPSEAVRRCPAEA
jgi:hypothetical protein